MKFREINIPFEDPKEYIQIVQEKITPLIKDLESNSLIERFHFIMHENLDLRLEANYDKDTDKIKNKLRKHGLNDELSSDSWSMPEDPEKYGGPKGLEICYRNLEYNSRIIMDLFEFKRYIETKTEKKRRQELKKGFNNLNGQFVHYFLIQQGINNIQEIDFHLQQAKSWASTVINNSPNLKQQHSELHSQLIEIIDFNPDGT